jgi:hypothetical protein
MEDFAHNSPATILILVQGQFASMQRLRKKGRIWIKPESTAQCLADFASLRSG